MLRYNGVAVNIGHFPDGTILMKQRVDDIIRHDIMWKYENNEELVALIYLVNHIRSKNNNPIDLYMPYVPNARQDRVKSQEDVFTLRWFAQTINSMKFEHVFIEDPHSYVSEALFDNVIVVDARRYISQAYSRVISETNDDPLLLFFPDEGAMKRYSGFCSCINTFGIKKRDWETGKITGLDIAGDIDKIRGSNILIIDDICSRGGTFTHSAKRLKDLGAGRIFLYVTHCENTIAQGDILNDGLIEKVFTTDSILKLTHEKIEVIK